MSNVIGLNEYAGLANSAVTCWLCQKPASTRAIFCHHCGTVQPVRDIDHFARLGVERRIDIDVSHLDHQFAALSRTLDPQRFLIRGMGERSNASKQLEALTHAHETLRDPLRRGRYWLSLHHDEGAAPADVTPMIVALRDELSTASEPVACDRVAQKAGQALEDGIMGLMQALRGQQWEQASSVLVHLDWLESILGDVRSKRSDLTRASR